MNQMQREKKLRKLVEAEGYLELNLPEQALEVLQALQPDPSFAFEYQLLRGLALRDLKRYAEALEPLEIAAAFKRSDLTLSLVMGWCLKRTGQLRRAIEVLQLAQDKHPEKSILHYNLACYYALAGDKPSALTWLGSALALSPNLSELIPDESDFETLRHDGDFQALCQKPTFV